MDKIITTSSGLGAICIIRASGNTVCDDLKAVLNPYKNEKFFYTHFFDDQGKILDDIMCAQFRAPNSYTGEDVFELHCHGSPYVVDAILKRFFELGYRQAGPGEMSKRAFLNGKINLTQAEGIRSLIEAETKEQWQVAQYLKEGRLSAFIQDLKAEILGALALIEARIDFPEEKETQDMSPVLNAISKLKTTLVDMKSRLQNAQIASRGLKIALVGAPNVGKSSLFNALLKEPRSIVSPTAGTTRDYIEEPLILNGRMVRLMDTAGLRETDDAIELEGIERTMGRIQAADLVLILHAADKAAPYALPTSLADKDCFHVLTKADLGWSRAMQDYIPVSTIDATIGTKKLIEEICAFFDKKVTGLDSQAYITDPRHRVCVDLATQEIETFLNEHDKIEDECLAVYLRSAIRHLNTLIGEITQDDVFDVIFSRFCIGK
jgi:tRNA modification GTPase